MKSFYFLALLVLVGLVNACGESGEASPADSNAVEYAPVYTSELKPTQFTSYLNLTGTVMARNHVQIMMEESGTLRKIIVDKGHYADAGQTLAVFENPLLEASYEQALAAKNQAELDFKSREALYKKKAISENEFLTSRYAMESATAAYNMARVRLDKLAIKSPMAGLVNERFYDIGAFATAMTPVFEFIDNAYMRIRVGVPERFISSIKEGTPVSVTFDAYPTLKIDSEVSFVSQSIDSHSRTFAIEVEVRNEARQLAPQMVANIKIQRNHYDNQVVIPVDALIESEAGWHVFIEKDDIAYIRQIEQIEIQGDQMLVSGVEAGENLITSGQHTLSDGDSVSVK